MNQITTKIKQILFKINIYIKEKIFILKALFLKDKFKNYNKKLIYSFSKRRLPSLKQLRYLNLVLSKGEKIVFYSSFLILIFSLTFLSVKFYYQHLVLTPTTGGTYTEALIGGPKYINPILAQTNDVDMDISRIVFSSLIKINKDNKVIPDIAENYTISQDNKTYTFYLKQNIFWHNGDKLNADDVVFTVKSIQNEDYKSPLRQNFLGVKIKKLDDYTVQFILEKPFAPFLKELTFGILPKNLWQNILPSNAFLADLNLKPIGSGPYKFKSFVKDKSGRIISYLLARNKAYYGRKAKIDLINFKFYDNNKEALLALKNHKVNGINYLSKKLFNEIKNKENLNLYNLQPPQYTAIFFNLKDKNNIVTDSKIRQALAYAINKNELISKNLDGVAKVIYSPIFFNYSGYDNKINKYNYNFNKANGLLDQTKWKRKPGEEFRKAKIENPNDNKKETKQELSVELTTVNQGKYILLSKEIKKYWDKIGVKTNIRTINLDEVNKEIVQLKNYQIFLYGEIVGADPDPYPFWHSSSDFNLSNYSNKDVDKLLEQARQTTDEKIRKEKYFKFQEILNKDLPAIFLYQPNYIYAVEKSIKGIDLDKIILPCDRFNNIEFWYIKERKSLKW